ncbi:MAG: hypothetical protein ABWZ52_04760 [Acidimicrobiales bacterium]
MARLEGILFAAGCYNTVAALTRSIELEVDPDSPDQLAPRDRG